MKLEGILVDLVPLHKNYRDLEHKWRNSEAAFWASGGDRYLTTRAQIERWMQHWFEEKQNGQVTGISFGVQIKDGTPIGGMSINFIMYHHRLAMLGAKIGESAYWGGGYGTDALILLIQYAFDWLDMRKIWLGTTSKNERVQRQMEKVGFTLEARQREESLMDGEWCDGLLYGLFREDWPGREALVKTLNIRPKG
jgi:RimJ/RimL family protein N-acetyltransferase